MTSGIASEVAGFDWAEYVKFLIALIAIIDIPGSIPIFLQQTADMTRRGRLVTGFVASAATAAILFVFAYFGPSILAVFGITIDAFKLLGGLVILLIALNMLGLMGSETETNTTEGGTHPVAVGIFPMAVPLFAGPGAISAVMVYSHEDFHWNHDALISLLILTVAGAIALCLAIASYFAQFLPSIAQLVLNRLLGMIVGALGIELILEGLNGFFPALG
ncbi:MarC family protein [Ruegeria sp. 2205SS24-7]|uniref:MarC family protein n=1 Tax=Ruegeria discodermiae TaxID=3064389 RepID=UPI0027408C71|nr:MarC family protein [Ruegeria sp. 2205SS24-7]MDP5217374.1 MarC family protein [Ruegeria sp. 2205SS24-7]